MRQKLMPEMKAPGTGISETIKVKKPVVGKIAKPKVPATKSFNKSLNDMIKLRKSVIDDVRSGKINEQDIMTRIQNSGIKDPLALETILSDTLNDNVIRFFLSSTKNNVKKAKSLAKKFGFEV